MTVYDSGINKGFWLVFPFLKHIFRIVLKVARSSSKRSVSLLNYIIRVEGVMNRISIESKFVTNEFLFELKRYKELNISEELYSFLLAVEFPWKALEKP